MRIALTIAALALAGAAWAAPRVDGPKCAGAKGPVDLAVCFDPRAAAADKAMSVAWSGHLAGLRDDAKAEALDGQRAWLAARDGLCPTATDVAACVASMADGRRAVLESALSLDGPDLRGGRGLRLGGDVVRFTEAKPGGGEDGIVGRVGDRVVYRSDADGVDGYASAVLGTRRFPGRDAAVLSVYSGGTMRCSGIDVLWRDAGGAYGSASLGTACVQDATPIRLWSNATGFGLARDATPSTPGEWTAWSGRTGAKATGRVAFEPVPFTTMAAVRPGTEPLAVAEFHHAVTAYGGRDASRLLAALWHAGGSGYDGEALDMSSVARRGADVAVTACGMSFDGVASSCDGATALALYDAAGAFRFAVADTSLPGVVDPVPSNQAFHPPLALWKPADLARLAPWWAAIARYEAGE